MGVGLFKILSSFSISTNNFSPCAHLVGGNNSLWYDNNDGFGSYYEGSSTLYQPSLCTSLVLLSDSGETIELHRRPVPADVGIILLFLPFIFSIIFPFISIRFIMMANLLSIFFVVFTLSYNGADLSMTWAVIVTLLSIFLHAMYRLQSMELFLYTTRYYEILRDQSRQERRTAQKLNSEMKNLIASISHDLKSVRILSSNLFLTAKIQCSLSPLSFMALKDSKIV